MDGWMDGWMDRKREREREWSRMCIKLQLVFHYAVCDRTNDRLFYRPYEHQQRPYLACCNRSAQPELQETGVTRRAAPRRSLVVAATTKSRNDLMYE